MSHPESAKVSYIRVFHELQPSPSLRALSRYAGELLLEESFEDQLRPSEITPEPPHVYPASSLRITVFEGSTPAGDDHMNELLKKLQYRLESKTVDKPERTTTTNWGKKQTSVKTMPNPLHKTISGIRKLYLGEPENEPDSLLVAAGQVVVSTPDEYRGPGTQLALELDDGDVTSFLEGESGAYIDYVAKINFARRLSRIEDARIARHIPILAAPFRSEAQIKTFIDNLSVVLPVDGIQVSKKPGSSLTAR